VSVWYDEEESTSLTNGKEAREAVLNETAKSVYEIPTKLDAGEAAWYYDLLENRRDEVYAMYFARLNRMDEWLEVYAAAKEGSPAKELAFFKLAALDLDAQNLIELREARFDDARIVELCERRIEKVAADNFDKWKEVYDLSPYGSRQRLSAMRRMRSLANAFGEWRDIYDRCEIGSPTQTAAAQNMLLLNPVDYIKRVNADDAEKEFIKRATERGAQEWRKEYDKYDLYDKRSELAAINIYLSADRSDETAGADKSQNQLSAA
jgi:hypothetical protein